METAESEALRLAQRAWLDCVVSGGLANAAAGASVELAVAEALEPCLGRRTAFAAAVESAKRAEGVEVTPEKTAALLADIDKLMVAGAFRIVEMSTRRPAPPPR